MFYEIFCWKCSQTDACKNSLLLWIIGLLSMYQDKNSLFWLQFLSGPLEVSVGQVLQRAHLVESLKLVAVKFKRSRNSTKGKYLSIYRRRSVFFKLSLDSGTWGDNKGWDSTWVVLSGSCCLLQMVDGALQVVFTLVPEDCSFTPSPVHPLTCSPTHASFNFDDGLHLNRWKGYKNKLWHKSWESCIPSMLLLIWVNQMWRLNQVFKLHFIYSTGHLLLYSSCAFWDFIF